MVIGVFKSKNIFFEIAKLFLFDLLYGLINFKEEKVYKEIVVNFFVNYFYLLLYTLYQKSTAKEWE